jgi:hypothetical protein
VGKLAHKAGLHDRKRKLPSWPVEEADNIGFETLPMLNAAESPLLYDVCCFPDSGLMGGEQKTAATDRNSGRTTGTGYLVPRTPAIR